MNAVEKIENQVIKEMPSFDVGDSLKVHLRVKEGQKTRIQVFEGVCIRKRGQGAGRSFTVIKESHGDTVEKVFPLYSPTIEKIVVGRKKVKARRAKLYYLRDKK